MSDIAITVQTITEIDAHPNADRLEIVKILGTQCVTGVGDHTPGEKVLYFPADMMIPEGVAEKLGVKKYLKHVRWNGKKVQSRIAACRLRGVPSFGFVIPCDQRMEVDTDVTAIYQGEKYEPPEVMPKLPGIKGGRRFHLEPGEFTMYTNIQHYWRYPGVFSEFGDDEQVVITEKIHGTNSRVGVLFEGDEWVYAAGSHKVRWMQCNEAFRYWRPLDNEGMLSMLAELCGECANVIVFGEIYGSSVQDMDYGVDGDEGYRVFDISVNGTYLDWDSVTRFCNQHGVTVVPVLYQGPWKCVSEVIDQYSSGRTCVGKSRGKFKDREGIVIKPVMERLTDKIGGSRQPHRAIVKYVSADYLDRKGAQDNA
jgi:RNA ligase (TIGR02306 family)